MTEIYREIMPPGRGTVRSFSAVMNIWGTVALVGGAIYSAMLFRRKQIMRNRMVCNWFIAAGHGRQWGTQISGHGRQRRRHQAYVR
jgi:hypothetical protein